VLAKGLIKKTVGSFLDENARKFSNQNAAVFVDRNIKYSWRELKMACNRAARAFLGLGIKRGDHIAIWATNYPEWLIAQFAAAEIGAVLVTINPEWKAAELKYVLKQSDSKVLVMIEEFKKSSGDKVHRYNYLEILEEVCPEITKQAADTNLKLKEFPLLERVILITAKDKKPAWAIGWPEFIRRGEGVGKISFWYRKSQVSLFDICLIQYTSGTTGFPKGAMLTHYGVVNNALEGARNMELSCCDRLCGPVSYFHCFGSIMLNLCCLVSGATMVIPAEHFNARKTLEAIEKEKCTALHGVPTMFIAELAYPEFERFNLTSLRTGIIAGAPCPIELMKDIVCEMGVEKITIVYGLTEASPITHQTRFNDPIKYRTTTVGKPIENTKSKIVDYKKFEETGEVVELGVREVGEIWVSGSNIMTCYYKKPEETQKAIVNGWLRTGDLGTKDENGYYKIIGRLKDMIIVGGHNVYPAEVEQGLLELFGNYIEAVQVFGVPHETLQEVVAAVIQLKTGKNLTADKIKNKCKDKMEWPKIPKHIKFVEDFSSMMVGSGKIKKSELKEAFIKELGLEELAKIKTA